MNPILQANIAVALFSAAAVLAQMTALDSITIVFGRTLFASTALFFLLRKGDIDQLLFRVSCAQKLVLITTGALLCGHWIAFFTAVTTGSVTISLITFATFPAFVITLNALFGLETTCFRNIAVVVAIMIGAIVPLQEPGDYGFAPWLYGFASAASFALLIVLSKQLIASVSAKNISLIQNTIAWPLALLFVPSASLGKVTSYQWLLLLLCGVICTAVAHTLIIGAMKKLSAFESSLYINLEPAYGILLAVMLLGDSVATREIIGGTIIVLAVAAGSYSKKPVRQA